MASALFEIVAEALRAGRVTELRERLGLDLPDALARHAELLAHLFERADLAVIETEPQSHDCALAIVELLQRFLNRFRQQRTSGSGRRRNHVRVFDEVAEKAV